MRSRRRSRSRDSIGSIRKGEGRGVEEDLKEEHENEEQEGRT
jgi:hypothetical protein